MGLSNRKEDQLRQMPIVKTRVMKSKDGKYLVHRVEITTIKPMAYYEAIIGNKESLVEADEDLQALAA